MPPAAGEFTRKAANDVPGTDCDGAGAEGRRTGSAVNLQIRQIATQCRETREPHSRRARKSRRRAPASPVSRPRTPALLPSLLLFRFPEGTNPPGVRGKVCWTKTPHLSARLITGQYTGLRPAEHSKCQMSFPVDRPPVERAGDCGVTGRQGGIHVHAAPKTSGCPSIAPDHSRCFTASEETRGYTWSDRTGNQEQVTS